MTCTAYDTLYFEGMKQPILGTYTLKLGDILAATREKDNKVIRELGSLIDECTTGGLTFRLVQKPVPFGMGSAMHQRIS